MLVVVVPAAKAEDLRIELHAGRLIDRGFRITKRGPDVVIPVISCPPIDLSAFGAHLEPAAELPPRPPARNPQEMLRRRLVSAGISPDLAPSKWERIGDVVVVRLLEAARAHAETIASALGEVLRCRTVVEDRSGIHGALRTPDVRVLWGDGTETVHLEGGVRYKLDVAKVMFASGNLAERTSIARKVRDEAVVVDLFAGIGYFVLPIAVHARPAAVYACELNHEAFAYLEENVRLNRVERVIPLLGDCRVTAPHGVADVVLMGHFSATEYLDIAFHALRGAGLVVYHELCPRELFPNVPLERFSEAARESWYDVESAHARIVKSFAPGIVHVVLEARVRQRPRCQRASS
jgi:tRNA wybutosine-synthesizing protein 2